MEALGIEQPAVIGLAAAAGPAMQIDRGNAVGAADAFDIDLVAVADGEQLRGQRRERDRRDAAMPCPRRRQAPWSPSVSSVPPAKLR